MTENTSRYIDPLTDFGFKLLFGNEPDKDILIEFLNTLFQGEKHIVDITYSATEYSGSYTKEKKVLFDLTCTGQDGEQFIIEMQRTGQKFFRDRCVFYMSRLISAQLPKGKDWNTPLKEVYLIGIMEFQFNNVDSNYLHNIALMNTDTGKVFYKGMGYKFLELPSFDKLEHELESDLDKWFYLLKNLSRLNKIPSFLDKRVFQKIFKIAEVSKLTKEQRELYESDIKAKSDWKGGMDWAKEQAAEQAAEQTQLNIASAMKKEGLTNELIAKLTKLSIEEIELITLG
ncbi:MAG: Rpn family recombination-promoting nuclease/putative transposase [Candidatus Pedobacter colombiensis]|uniref:Rpn family recombination-promoting nuclease/putative transposase n=1 Tax=Candidatus Pedobacter colombiensis TaxID=3121371 RepID=A0AAJ5W5V3_9SPHI|nr:Rpn family recombination-promoting nuclease/putative transposase [Pedobacter sp.]WEK17683.1 MAG: Rpn family recombination-promoting nuclease/putative transposase [Pedobacter sp.]